MLVVCFRVRAHTLVAVMDRAEEVDVDALVSIVREAVKDMTADTDVEQAIRLMDQYGITLLHRALWAQGGRSLASHTVECGHRSYGAWF